MIYVGRNVLRAYWRDDKHKLCRYRAWVQPRNAMWVSGCILR